MAPVFPAWSVPSEEVLQHHSVELTSGLSSKEVEARRERYGYNELTKSPGTPLWKLILEQFDDTLVKVSEQKQRQHPHAVWCFQAQRRAMPAAPREWQFLLICCCASLADPAACGGCILWAGVV